MRFSADSDPVPVYSVRKEIKEACQKTKTVRRTQVDLIQCATTNKVLTFFLTFSGIGSDPDMEPDPFQTGPILSLVTIKDKYTSHVAAPVFSYSFN